MEFSTRAAELTTLLESRIGNFYTNFQVDEIGRVVSIGDGIARVYDFWGSDLSIRTFNLNLEVGIFGVFLFLSILIFMAGAGQRELKKKEEKPRFWSGSGSGASSYGADGTPPGEKDEGGKRKRKRPRPNEDNKDRRITLLNGLRTSLIYKLQELLKADLRLPPPHFHRLRSAIDRLEKIQPENWTQMVTLLEEVRTQGAESDLFKKVKALGEAFKWW